MREGFGAGLRGDRLPLGSPNFFVDFPAPIPADRIARLEAHEALDPDLLG